MSGGEFAKSSPIFLLGKIFVPRVKGNHNWLVIEIGKPRKTNNLSMCEFNFKKAKYLPVDNVTLLFYFNYFNINLVSSSIQFYITENTRKKEQQS